MPDTLCVVTKKEVVMKLLSDQQKGNAAGTRSQSPREDTMC